MTQKPSNLYWITCALTAGAFMGLGNFIYASNFSRFGLKGLGVMGPGVLSTFLIVKLAREYHYFKKQGRWFKT